MSSIKVVLVEWMGYPLYRKKVLFDYSLNCGLGRLLDNMNRYNAGEDHETLLVVNEHPPSFKRVGLLGAKVFDRLFLNNPRTNSPEKFDDYLANYAFVKEVFYRENLGQDLGAYDFAFQHLKARGHDGDVVFINSSSIGPVADGWLSKYKNLFYKHEKCGLCGISVNSHHAKTNRFLPHVQSFFLYTNMKILDDVFPNGLYQSTGKEEKIDLILGGEIKISQDVIAKGYGISSSMFPDFCYKEGDEWTIPYRDLRLKKEFRTRVNLI